jgi:signal transduction histidine kinase
LKATNEKPFSQRASEQTRQLAKFLDENEAVLKDIDEGVVIFDLDGRAAAVNPAAARLLARPVRELVDRDISALAGENVRVHHGQVQTLKLYQGDKVLLMSLAPVRDTSGQTICTVAVIHDSAHRAEVDRIRSDFVCLASHELRTPLSAVLGYIDMLREDVYGPLTNQQRGAVDRAAANTEQLVSLVNNLLDQAQIEAGGLALNNVPFVPGKLVENVQTVMSMAARHKGLELTTHIADDMPGMLYGDFQRLCQILTNLVDNAIKFTESGAVHLQVYKPAEDRWALEVSDTGCGIPQEAQSYIFTPFRQGDDPMQREYRGAGLGLSIVQQLVALMDGEIRLESEVGKGSTFTVVLPLVAGNVERPSSEAGERPLSMQEGIV